MKAGLQKILPQHFISKTLGSLANARLGRLTRYAIKQFIQHYKVNMQEAKIADYQNFSSFNDFFTRELKEGARPICHDKNSLISPVDGCVSEIGVIEQDQLLQAKNHYFNLKDLCGGDLSLSSKFHNGNFLTAYLSPKDYHRFHMPIAGKLKKMIYVPGSLFSVNAKAVKSVSNLFARNERVICVFETAIGDVAVIAVGAMIVGSISILSHGVVAPKKPREVQQWLYANQHIILERGDELGHFRLGSTIIILTEQNKIAWDENLKAESQLKVGVKIGDFK